MQQFRCALCLLYNVQQRRDLLLSSIALQIPCRRGYIANCAYSPSQQGQGRTVEGGDLAMGNGESARTPLSLGILFPQRGTPRYTSLFHAYYLGTSLERRGDCGMRAGGNWMMDRK